MPRTTPPTALALALILSACGGEPPRTDGAEADETGPTFPLDADIWTATLSRSADGALSVGPPREAIHRQGYDNQPHFTPDGSAFWFTALDEHTGQTDIWRYGLDGGFEQVTVTAPESEYSPTPLPDGTGISVVRVEADSTQRLWRIPAGGGEPEILLPDVRPVGYHAWVDQDAVALFVLGEPPTLQVAHLDGGVELVAEGIGRSIRSIPGADAVSFVRLGEDGTATLMRYDADGTVTELGGTVGNGEFHAWTPDGTVLMAEGARIFAWTPGSGQGWTPVVDLSEHRVVVTRLAVSPDGTQIAMVVEPGEVSL